MQNVVAPDGDAGMTIWSGPNGRLGCAESGGTRGDPAADQTARIVVLTLAAFVARRRGGRRMALADFDGGKRIRNGSGKRPARTNWCKDLHHQRHQEDRKIDYKPPTHREAPSRQRTPVSVPLQRVERVGRQRLCDIADFQRVITIASPVVIKLIPTMRPSVQLALAGQE